MYRIVKKTLYTKSKIYGDHYIVQKKFLWWWRTLNLSKYIDKSDIGHFERVNGVVCFWRKDIAENFLQRYIKDRSKECKYLAYLYNNFGQEI